MNTPEQMPHSWGWVTDTMCFLHILGDHVVWQSMTDGMWYGYERRRHSNEDEFDRKTGPHKSAQMAALTVIALSSRTDTFNRKPPPRAKKLKLNHQQPVT